MEPDDSLYFDDVEVGQDWLSAERVVSEADIVGFADLTGDRQPIHLDEEFAQTTPFRRCIAHGLLGLSLASGLTVTTVAIRTQAFLGLREWYFRAPVFPGDTLRVRTTVLEKEVRTGGRRGQVVWRVEVFNQHGVLVQEGVSVTLVEGRAARKSRKPAGSDSSGVAA